MARKFTANSQNDGLYLVNIAAGFAVQGSLTPIVERRNGRGDFRGGFSNTGLAINATFTIATIPDSNFRPIQSFYGVAATDLANLFIRYQVQDNGNINVVIPGTLPGWIAWNASWVCQNA